MKRIAFLILGAVVLSGCAGATAPGQNVSNDGILSAIKYVHDDTNKVGCWFYIGTDGHASLSCLSDKDYK